MKGGCLMTQKPLIDLDVSQNEAYGLEIKPVVGSWNAKDFVANGCCGSKLICCFPELVDPF